MLQNISFALDAISGITCQRLYSLDVPEPQTLAAMS